MALPCVYVIDNVTSRTTIVNRGVWANDALRTSQMPSEAFPVLRVKRGGFVAKNVSWGFSGRQAGRVRGLCLSGWGRDGANACLLSVAVEIIQRLRSGAPAHFYPQIGSWLSTRATARARDPDFPENLSARGRSDFPTPLSKSAVFSGSLPTDSGQNPPIRSSRWGVPRTCGAELRIASNGAGFRACQSLHIMRYRKFKSREA